MPKYPDIHVQLTGEDGNAFFILAKIEQAMSRAGVGKEEIETFDKEAKSGDYNHLLGVCMLWVDCG